MRRRLIARSLDGTEDFLEVDMGSLSQRTILTTYLMLLVATTMLLLLFAGYKTLPSQYDPQAVEVRKLVNDANLAEIYKIEFEANRQRLTRLTDIVAGAFTTVIGALIGFLSAANRQPEVSANAQSSQAGQQEAKGG